jgi:uncharacterized protein YjaZ
MTDNKKLPGQKATNDYEKMLGQFLCKNTQNFRKKDDLMKQKDIYNIWKKYVSSCLFLNKKNALNIKFDMLQNFISCLPI